MSIHVAITGATGVIGAAVLTELLTRGSQVTVLLRPGSNRTRLVAMKGFEALTCSRLAYIHPQPLESSCISQFFL